MKRSPVIVAVRKVRDFAMAFQARKVSGDFEKRAQQSTELKMDRSAKKNL